MKKIKKELKVEKLNNIGWGFSAHSWIPPTPEDTANKLIEVVNKVNEIIDFLNSPIYRIK